MSTRTHAWNLPILIWWIIIIAVACIVYTAEITHESIWYDEAYSAGMAEHPLPKLITLVGYDNHPPSITCS